MVKVFVSFFFSMIWMFSCCLFLRASLLPAGGRREGGGEDAGGEGLASSGHQPTAAAGWFLAYGSERLSEAHDKSDLMSSC